MSEKQYNEEGRALQPAADRATRASTEPVSAPVSAVPAGIPSAVWTTQGTVAAHLAMWAIRQSPYDWPDDLREALDSFRAVFPADEFGLSSWESAEALEAAIWQAIEASPEILAWNVPKSGHDAPMVFSSRYDSPSPDDDIIDLYALRWNVASSVWLEERAAQGIEARSGETAPTSAGSTCESPVAEGHAPTLSNSMTDTPNDHR